MTSEFEKYSIDNEESINQKAWAIIEVSGDIKFTNKQFDKMFNLGENANLKEINLEPNLSEVINNLSHSEVSGFSSVYIHEIENEIITGTERN